MRELAKAFVSVVPSMRGSEGRLRKEFKGAGGASSAAFGGAFVGGLSRVVAPLAALGLGASLMKSISLASDLEESASKMALVFKGQTLTAMKKFAAEAPKALGQSELAARDALAQFAMFGDIAGMTGSKLGKFSTSMTTLATDFASLHNTEPSEAIEAMGAAFRGEYEPMRKYMVLLDEETLKQRALKMGIVSTTKNALKPQQRVLAVQAELMAQGKVASGDFARTQGGLANQTRIFKASMETLSGNLGKVFLPVATRVVTMLNDYFVPAMEGLAEYTMPLKRAFTGTVESVLNFTKELGPAAGKARGLVSEVGGSAGVMNRLRGAIDRVTEAVAPMVLWISGNAVPAFRAVLRAVMPVVTWFRDQLVPALLGVVEAVAGYYVTIAPIVAQFVGGMVERLGPLMPWIKGLFADIGSIIVSAMGLISEAIKGATVVISFIWKHFGRYIMDFIALVLKTIVGIVSGLMGMIKNMFRGALALIRGDWTGYFNAVKGFTAGFVRVVVSIFSFFWGRVGIIFRAILSTVTGVWRSVGNVISNGIRGIVSQVSGIRSRVAGAIGNVGSILYNSGRNLISGFIRGIRDMAGAAASAASSVVQRVRDHFPFSPAKVGPMSGSGYPGHSGGKMVRDFAAGMRRSRGVIDSAMSDVLPGASDIAVGASGRLGRGVSVTQNIRTEDPRAAAQMAAARLDFALGGAL